MDVNELLALDRPLTPRELAAVEDELLRLAQELQKEITRIAEEVGPDAPEVERLQRAAADTLRNIEEAIAIPVVPVAPGDAREA